MRTDKVKLIESRSQIDLENAINQYLKDNPNLTLLNVVFKEIILPSPIPNQGNLFFNAWLLLSDFS